MVISLRYAARSDVGLVRSNNQDSAYAGPNLLVVADGMGGHAGGDIASRIAIAALEPLDTPDHGPQDALADLEAAVEDARQGLVRASAAEPDLSGMGTTVTALLRTGSTLVMAHMGDSRAYLLRDGALTQVTVDHTFVQHLVDTGRISPDEAEHHPQRNVVMRVLSDFDMDLAPDMSVREAKVGDRWMLCSDGLSGFVPPELLTEILTETPDPGEAADLLLLAAMRAGSTDNITVVVADVVDEEVEAPVDEAETSPEADDPGIPAAAEPAVGGVQVVGAASADGPLPGLDAGTDPAPATDGPEHADVDRSQDDDVDDLDEEDDADDADARPEPRRHPVVATLATVIVLGALGYGAWEAYGWTQEQYYVGVADEQVAVYRGIPASAGPLTLSEPVELTGTRVDELPAYWVDRLDGTIRASSLEDARARAERLIAEALPPEEQEEEPTPAPAEPTPEPPPAEPEPAPEAQEPSPSPVEAVEAPEAAPATEEGTG
ncbi:serine/threonine-protein phosphatase [Xylanimonas oleitrophica]|uniref:Serine/threonine-protein phosphatase n=1 Tax=Xylanimonas oleitrophica TaxID=2607479 RepID=A0A2W5XT40_9MICO|nr:protein phosphatase 2C domain-containing protein [Xylanimonas oleitrophica]PZR53178.1 serine/threonine-protein phosphatase [Xylanimonas oleitrophica]